MNSGALRILFVHSSAEMYGSDRCLYELVKRIDKKRFFPVVVLPFEGELNVRLRELGVPVYVQDPWVLRKGTVRSIKFIAYLFRLPVSVLRLLRIIRKESIAVVYSNTSVIVGSPLSSFFARKPHICHLREFYDNYPRLARLYRLFLCVFSRRIVAISHAVASFVEPVCSRKVRVVYDGIDLDRFRSTDRAIPDVLSRWEHEKRIIVANIGRVSPIKGHELFVAAARQCSGQNGNLRFLIVGDVFSGNEQFIVHLRDMVREYGLQETVQFAGFRTDVDDFIAHSDIIVLSTIIREGLGQIVMEGMAAGKVVIAPDRGGPVELIENGIDGMLYRSSDAGELAGALLKAAGDPGLRQSIAGKARDKAASRFGIQNSVAAMERLIGEEASV